MSERKSKLTRREQEVLALVELGSKADESARLLAVRPSTIVKHRSNARRKLAARTLPHLVYLALTASEPVVDEQVLEAMQRLVDASRP